MFLISIRRDVNFICHLGVDEWCKIQSYRFYIYNNWVRQGFPWCGHRIVTQFQLHLGFLSSGLVERGHDHPKLHFTPGRLLNDCVSIRTSSSLNSWLHIVSSTKMYTRFVWTVRQIPPATPSGFDFLFRTRPRALWQQTPPEPVLILHYNTPMWHFGPANVTFWTCQCDFPALRLFLASGTLPRELKNIKIE